VIDGEAVVLRVNGVADFNALHSRKHNDEVQLCAFDVMALDGEGLRQLPLSSARPTSPGCWLVGPMAFRCAIRTGQDRSGPVRTGLQVWA
jgi:hypothetical protein